jgi:hypothetical protein
VGRGPADLAMIDWTDAQLDEAFLRADAQPLDGFVNTGAYRIDAQSREICNDRHWKGFMPRGLPTSEATARLSLGFVKALWKTGSGFGGETHYFGGGVITAHTVEEVTLDRQVHDLPAGRYVLLGYKDALLGKLFYDVLKPVSPDAMLFRGYTGAYPRGRRGWTALLLRRYPFAEMGIDDYGPLAAGGRCPADEQLLGSWRCDALYHANRPLPIAGIRFSSDAGGVEIDCEASDAFHRLLLHQLLAGHFDSAHVDAVRAELRRVDDRCMVGKWITDLRGAHAKLLLAAAPGLFQRESGAGVGRRFALYYTLTRTRSSSSTA